LEPQDASPQDRAPEGGLGAPAARVGAWLVGAGGSVATTTRIGAAAVAAGLSPPTGLVTALAPFDRVPLPKLSELVFGGHDLVDTPSGQAGRGAGSRRRAAKLAAARRRRWPGRWRGRHPPRGRPRDRGQAAAPSDPAHPKRCLGLPGGTRAAHGRNGQPRLDVDIAPANDRMITAASAVELLHLGTLYHDDVIDEAETRRVGPASTRVGATPSRSLPETCFWRPRGRRSRLSVARKPASFPGPWRPCAGRGARDPAAVRRRAGRVGLRGGDRGQDGLPAGRVLSPRGRSWPSWIVRSWTASPPLVTTWEWHSRSSTTSEGLERLCQLLLHRSK
jgi:hypothetical protein